MPRRLGPALCLLLFSAAFPAVAGDGNRLAYLDENDPWYPHRGFPKLVTPQWVGEEGVECVVTLAIDDMREPAKYEAYLRPILQRLKQIDGRAPVSIMTCSVKPDDPQLQTWLDEGVSLEVHTVDHPCPLLQGGDLAKAKSTYDRCVDLLSAIPNNKPVAYRMPCCDSLNTVSPRFFAEIFNKQTEQGRSLSISSSVFNLSTGNDPDVPRELALDAQGRERFRRYLPKGLKRGDVTHNTFVNWIEDYPYPYVINRLCWEFPCVVPSDWEAQFLQQPNNPQTVADLKAALDITVHKQGVFNFVFHPHGWIEAEQVVELIDHAVAKHGRKVKFLTFRECLERLNANLLAGQPLRDERGGDNGVRVLDVDTDGYLDVVIGSREKQETRLWQPGTRRWTSMAFPRGVTGTNGEFSRIRFGTVGDDARTAAFDFAGAQAWIWEEGGWQSRPTGGQRPFVVNPMPPLSRFRATYNPLDAWLGDFGSFGRSSLVLTWKETGAKPDRRHISWSYDWHEDGWSEMEPARFFHPPKSLDLTRPHAMRAIRFVDINEDGGLDLLYSDAEQYSVYLLDMKDYQWSEPLLAGRREGAGAVSRSPDAAVSRSPDRDTPPTAGLPERGKDSGDLRSDERRGRETRAERIVLPPIVRADGTDNGFFVHSRHLFWQNEDTAHLPDLVERRSFDELLGDRQPGPKTPEASLKCMRVRPGYTVELVAAEPLTMDPVAFDWGPDGRLWVVEMGDYPSGEGEIDGASEKSSSLSVALSLHRSVPSGGRVRVLEDTDDDGRYDKSTLFLDGIPFPTGVRAWRGGLLITAAPDVLYAEDTDGDSRADKREVLFTGFGEGNQQHRVNGLEWGLDNWLYVGNGDSGGTVRSLKTGDEAVINGRDLRIHPDSGRLEALSGQTQFGRPRDDWGNWFGCNNSNPLWHYVLDDHYLRRNPHVAPPSGKVNVSVAPGAAPCFPISRTLERFNDFDRANRFTSACSAIVYRDDLFGPAFEGNSFVSEPVHNLVHREVMEPQGVTFSSRRADDEQQSEFLASTDNWFRPTTIKVGPDGALWIADMYRHVIEHPKWIPDEWQQKLDLRAGHDMGRIYRVVPIGERRRPIPKLGALDTPQLVAALDSPSGWQRDMAQQLLVHRDDRDAVPLLEALARDSKRPQARLHALCALDGLGALKPLLVQRALADEQAGVRRHAVRLAEPFLRRAERTQASGGREPPDSSILDRTKSVEVLDVDSAPQPPLPPLRKGGSQTEAEATDRGTQLLPRDSQRPVLSAQLASNQRADAPRSPEAGSGDVEPLAAALLALLDDPDPQVQLQLAYSLGEWRDDRAATALGRLAVRHSGEPQLFAAVLSSLHRDNYSVALSAALAAPQAAADRPRAIASLLALSRHLGDIDTLADALAVCTAPRNGRLEAWQFRALAALLAAYGNERQTFESWQNAGHEPLRRQAQQLPGVFDAARRAARDVAAAEVDRAAAIELLGRLPRVRNPDVELLEGLLVPQTAAAVQSAAIARLVEIVPDAACEAIFSRWKSFSPPLRTQAVAAILSRRPERLLDALEARRLSASELSAAHREQLLRQKSKPLAARAERLLRADLDPDRERVVAAYRPAASQSGDAVRGQVLFAKTCAVCHRFDGAGHEVGPDLAGLRDRSAEALLVAVLDPNRAVEDKYLNYIAVTADGRTLSGLLGSETATSITLLAQEGRRHELLRSEIEELSSTSKSTMPEGLEKDLKPEDLRDIISYVQSHGR